MASKTKEKQLPEGRWFSVDIGYKRVDVYLGTEIRYEDFVSVTDVSDAQAIADALLKVFGVSGVVK